MADTFFCDESALLGSLENVAADILMNDVRPVAIEIFKKHIASDIYAKYSPKPNGWVDHSTYQRRHVLEGGVFGEMEGADTLNVTSNASPDPSILGYPTTGADSGFLRLLESGNMGIWKNGFPRPVIPNVQAEYNSSAEISAAIEKGIKRMFK